MKLRLLFLCVVLRLRHTEWLGEKALTTFITNSIQTQLQVGIRQAQKYCSLSRTIMMRNPANCNNLGPELKDFWGSTFGLDHPDPEKVAAALLMHYKSLTQSLPVTKLYKLQVRHKPKSQKTKRPTSNQNKSRSTSNSDTERNNGKVKRGDETTNQHNTNKKQKLEETTQLPQTQPPQTQTTQNSATVSSEQLRTTIREQGIAERQDDL